MEFIGECLPALKRFALFLTRNSADADDLVGWTVLKAIEFLRVNTCPIEHPEAWLKKIAKRQFIERFCVKKKVDAGRCCYFENYGATEPNQETAAQAREVQMTVNQLEYVDGEIVRLHLCGYSIKEISLIRRGKFRSSYPAVRSCIERFQHNAPV